MDVDTGAVLASLNARTPLPPASISKVMVALAAVRSLPAGTKVVVSPRAAAAPAHKIGMVAGQVWRLDDVLHAVLMSSANDAAVALAERVSGSVEKFQATAGALASQLGMSDRPVFRDPAGLDDSTSVGGGNLAGARDLAIAGRALLASPTLAAIVGQRTYSFTGPDGAHKLVNHNKLLSRYPGAIGLKTGYTVKAGGTLMAAARRNGRTMLTVVLGSPDIYGPTAALLDKGFATPVRAEPVAGRLPPVAAARPAAPKAKPVRKAAPRPAAPPRRLNLRGVASVPPAPPLPVVTVGVLGGAVALRRRAVLRRRASRLRFPST